MDPFIIGIRFQKIGKIYHFDATRYRNIKLGDFVVVETSRGRQLGEVMQTYDQLPPAPPTPEGSWKSVERLATPRDLVMRQMWGRKELEATINCRAKMADMGISGVKIVASEFSFDGSRLTFLYSSESGDRQELTKLRSAMQRTYSRTKVEMRQIGPRDVAKILGGMGACGLETRCCSMFLTEFSPVSIKMAKEQGISLTPSEITGMCGRLRCCLVYEYEQYVEARKTLPKRGKKVVSPLGEGKVIDLFPLKQSVMVQHEDGSRHEYMKFELQPWDELEALRRKAESPCDRHENGECDCGKSENKSQTKSAEAQQEIMVDEELQGELEDEIDSLVGLQDSRSEENSPQEKSSPKRASSRKSKSSERASTPGKSQADQPDTQAGSSPSPQKKRYRRPYRRKRSGKKSSNQDSKK